MKRSLTMLLCGIFILPGCAEEPKPTTVTYFLDNPIALEAALVHCGQNRSESRYEAECVNARQAISIIEAKEERSRKAEFELESDKKREALRRTQQAAAEARRRSEEAQRKREEAEYLAQFGELPPADSIDITVDESAANAPGIVVPEATDSGDVTNRPAESTPASDGGNAPSATASPVPDLDAVRDELRRRAEETVD